MMKPVAATRRNWRLRRMKREEHGDLEPVYIWDWLVRLTHWTIVISVGILAVTGYYISKPFVTAAGPAGTHFTTGWIRVVHFYAAIAFSCAVLARVVWIFLGPRRSGWREFIPTTKERFRHIFGVLKFYALMSKEPPMAVGHNPLAGLSYVFAYTMYGVLVLTGFALYSVNAPTSYMHFWQFLLPILHGAQGARWLHHVSMWLLLMFVTAHVSISIFVSRTEHNGTLDSIFSGYKYLPKDRHADDEER